MLFMPAMFTIPALSATSALVLSLGACVSAVPLSLPKRDVVVPPITSPTAGTVWTVGQPTTVTWDTSELPPPQNITNKQGSVILGFFDSNQVRHVNLDSPLSQGFNILTGSVSFTVPDVPPLSTYFIILFGDSGNNSQNFTITGSSSSSSSSPSSSPTSASGSLPSGSTSSPTTGPTSKPTETAVPPPPPSSSDGSSGAGSASSSASGSSAPSPTVSSAVTTATSPVPSITTVASTSTQFVAGTSSAFSASGSTSAAASPTMNGAHHVSSSRSLMALVVVAASMAYLV